MLMRKTEHKVRLKITLFTDPMMGLSYESEPFLRQVETHFGNQIKWDIKMGGLVRDVRHFMCEDDYWDGETQVFTRYHARLARIYQSEQMISGLPIHLTADNLHLFSPTQTSSLPLNLAYHAAKLADPSLAETFLYRLRYELIVNARPIMALCEQLAVAEKVGIASDDFLHYYRNGKAEQAMLADFADRTKLGIQALPAYLFEYQGKSMLAQGVLNYPQFAEIILSLSQGKIRPQAPEFTVENLQKILQKRPLVSLIELQYAFGLTNIAPVKKKLMPLIKRQEICLNEFGFIA